MYSKYNNQKHYWKSLKANFGATTYSWQNMPNSVTSKNTEVARLMFHVGVALSMNYGVDGSSAYNSYDPNSLYIFEDDILWSKALNQLSKNDESGIIDGYRYLAPGFKVH